MAQLLKTRLPTRSVQGERFAYRINNLHITEDIIKDFNQNEGTLV